MPNTSHNHPHRPGNGLHNQNEPREGYSQKENGVPVPGAGGFRNGMMPGAPMFDLARSPPGAPNKSAYRPRASARNQAHPRADTKHVPCKFFRQGTCQAGNACPFSHSLDPLTHQAPCKYFSKVCATKLRTRILLTRPGQLQIRRQMCSRPLSTGWTSSQPKRYRQRHGTKQGLQLLTARLDAVSQP